MIIRRYFLSFLIFIIIYIEHSHFCSIKCFVIICVLRNVISTKWISPFICRLSIFSEILHRGKHHLLLITFQWIKLFIRFNIKVELSSLNIVNMILLSNAGLMLILNMKWLGVIIIARVISKYIIISELLLFLIKCYLFPQSHLTLILL